MCTFAIKMKVIQLLGEHEGLVCGSHAGNDLGQQNCIAKYYKCTLNADIEKQIEIFEQQLLNLV